MLERRFIAGLTVDGRTLTGRALRYGDTAEIQTGFGVKRETFARGAFGNVSKLDTTLDLMHAPERRIARTQGGGLTLTQDGDDILLAATLPETRDASDTLALVRSGVLRGYSIEFSTERDRWEGDLRVIEAAGLPSIAVVDRPAYLSATGIELRRSLTNPADTGGVHVPPATGGRREGAILGDAFPLDGSETPKPRRRRLWQLL